MKNNGWKRTFARGIAALFAAMFVFALGFAGTSSTDVVVADADELASALADAETAGGTVNISYAPGVTSITLGASASIPSNVVLNLGLSSGTLRVTGGTLSVSGTIAGGALEIAGGTLIRSSGSSITSTITVSSGSVRGARMLSLENLPVSGSENIVSITYGGISGEDTSPFVTRAANGTIYPLMTGSGYGNFAEITSVTTDAGHVFRLGTRNTAMLSLAYVIAYAGLEGSRPTGANPGNYTASDAAITLSNPTKEGYLFQGWTCVELGITEPTASLTIAEGTTGALTFVANWVVNPAGGSGVAGGTNNSSPNTSGSEPTPEAAATPAPSATNAGTDANTKHVKTASSSTKVTFTSDADLVEPTLESVRGKTFPWGWAFLGVGGAAAVGYAIALISRKHRENTKKK